MSLRIYRLITIECSNQCSEVGAYNVACDYQTGECDCRPNVTGNTCDSCATGYYNLTTNGCSNCSCSQYATSEICNENGDCNCPENVTPPKCSECEDGFYGLSINGCMSCGCNINASTSKVCDKETGNCNCTEGAIGPKCTECPDTHYEANGFGQDYCVECFCFNHTTNCTRNDNNYLKKVGVTSVFDGNCTTEAECTKGWEFKSIEIIPFRQDHFDNYE